jgi:AraC family L-rhamnose operon transcriptional activator RhaR
MLWPGVGDGVVRIALSHEDQMPTRHLLERLASPPDDEPRLHQLGHLLLLLRLLARGLDPLQLENAERLASTPAVSEALRLMSSDLARSWTVEELAAHVGLSRSRLTTLFRRSVGRSLIAHLSALRAEAAAVRLLRTPAPVSDVGAEVGWSDPNYFARRFRAHFGISPTEFRHQQENGFNLNAVAVRMPQ